MVSPIGSRPRLGVRAAAGLRAWLGIALVLFALFGVAAALQASVGDGIATIVVFPVENLTGGDVPAAEVRQFLIDRLASRQFRVLDDRSLDAFMTRHRVRYAAGIDAATAEALRKETGVDAVVFASVERSSDAIPPKVGLIVRLVSIKAAPRVVWSDDAGLSGDDARGLFELRLVNDYKTLLTRALTRVSDSLVAYLTTGEASPVPKPASKFRPKSAFRGPTIRLDRPCSVAVLPFVNLSDRRNAGEILALLFVRHLSDLPQVEVVETGVARQQLLDARIIMEGGPSFSDAETLAALTGAEFVLAGRVLKYEDYEGPEGRTRVEFSTVLIERKSRRVVWSSESDNEGTDGVLMFERGTAKTAHAMATQMVRLATEAMAGRAR